MSSHAMEGENVHQQLWDSKDDMPTISISAQSYCAFKAKLTVKGLTCPRLYQGRIFLKKTFYVRLLTILHPYMQP